MKIDHQIDLRDLKSQALENIDKILSRCGLSANKSSTRNELRFGKGQGSLVLQINGNRAGQWYDHGGSYTVFGQSRSGGDLVHLIGAFDSKLEKYGHAVAELNRMLNGEYNAPVRERRAPKAIIPKSDVSQQREKIIADLVERSQSISGTLAERYLKARGLDMSIQGVRRMVALNGQVIRFIPDARSYSGKWFHTGPALLLMGRDDEGRVTNLQQVFLSEEGSAKAKIVDPDERPLPAKKSLGLFENPALLAGSSEKNPAHVALVEGPENGMTLRSVEDIDVMILFGLSNAFKVELPDQVTHVTLVSDGDAPDSQAGKSFTDLSRHLRCLGYHVREIRVHGDAKKDINDLAREAGIDAVRDLVSCCDFQKPHQMLTIDEGVRQLSLVTDDITRVEVARANIYASIRNPDAAAEIAGFRSLLVNELVNGDLKDQLVREIDGIASSLGQCLDVRGMLRNDRIEAFRTSVLGIETAQVPGGIMGLKSLVDGDEFLLDEIVSLEHSLRMLVGCTSLMNRTRRLWLQKAELSERPRARLVLASPGTGKTTSLRRSISETSGDAVVWVLMPRTDKAEEFYNEIVDHLCDEEDGRAVFQIRGRSAPTPDGQGTMCARADVAEKVAASGRGVYSSLCKRNTRDEYGEEVEELCPFFNECAYIRQRDELKAHKGGGVFVATHAALTMPIEAPRPDLVFVDEDPAMSMMRESMIPLDRIRLIGSDEVSVVMNDAAHDPRCVDVTPEIVEKAPKILASVREALDHAAPLPRMISEVGSDSLRELGAAFKAAVERGLDDITPDMPEIDIHDRISAPVRIEMKRLSRLLLDLAREVAWAEGSETDIRKTFNGVTVNHAAKRDVGGMTERFSAVSSFRLARINISKRVPIVVMDATADPELLERALGRPMDTVRIDVQRKGQVVQLIGRSFSNQSLSGVNASGVQLTNKFMQDSDRLRSGVIDLLKREAKRTRNGLFVCASKGVRGSFVSDFAPSDNIKSDAMSDEAWGDLGVSWAHFGATRGMNKWEDRETAVIVGRKQIPPVAAINGARCFYWNDHVALDVEGQEPRYEKVKGKFLKKDGAAVDVEIDVAADKMVHRILWQNREAEIIQSMDRVRATRHVRRIVLLSAIDLRMIDDDLNDPGLGLPADEIKSWMDSSRMESRSERIMNEFGGFIPLSAQILHKASNEFASLEAAKKWLLRSEFSKGTESKYESIWSLSPLKVRLAGQRGARAMTVIVDVTRFLSVSDARNHIQESLGCEFSLFEQADMSNVIVWGGIKERAESLKVEASEEVTSDIDVNEPFSDEPVRPADALTWRSTSWAGWLENLVETVSEDEINAHLDRFYEIRLFVHRLENECREIAEFDERNGIVRFPVPASLIHPATIDWLVGRFCRKVSGRKPHDVVF